MQNSLVEDKIAMMDSVAQQARQETITIESRFGEVEVRPAKAISFPHGIPGVPGSNNFCLTEMPNINNKSFKLLQSLDNSGTSFIVVPACYDNQLLEENDLQEACGVLGISKDNLLILFLVTAHETKAGRRLSVNAKAPVFIDAARRNATQYVFQHNKYDIQHFIS